MVVVVMVEVEVEDLELVVKAFVRLFKLEDVFLVAFEFNGSR